MADRPLGAQLSHHLKAQGVEVIFGIPGVHNIELYRGIEEAGLTHVLARHEQGAGFMADGYARATGTPGVAYVITGPGLCNIMTPMGQAYSDSVPMLVLSSCLEGTDLPGGAGRLHEMGDQRGAAACVCDWSEEVAEPAAAYGLIERAFAEFAAQRARPKHLQVPIAALGQVAPPAPPPGPRPGPAAPAAEEVAAAAEWLRGATRPLFVFGGGAVGGYEAARQVVAASGAASFTTYAGRGIIAPGAPLHFGAWLARPGSAEVIASADLVIAVGTELAEVDLWRDHLGHDAPMIRVDIDPGKLSDSHPADMAITGDAAAFLAALAAALQGQPPATGWQAQEVAAAQERWRAESGAERPGIVPICDALRRALPDDAMVYSDMTQFAYVAKEVVEMPRPGLWHHPYGFGTLGYALPAAIGGKIGRGAAPVVAIAGDYGFQYTLQELGVAVELGLSLPILLWDNGKLGEIEAAMLGSQIAPNAVIAQNPDFCALARAYGAGAAAPRSLGALRQAVAEALAANGPTLIHITPETARG